MYKDYEFEPQLLTRSLLAALFAGLIAALSDQAYNFFYREITGFVPSEIINVSSLIFGTLIFFMIGGVVYYLLAKFTKKPVLFFTILFLVITAFALKEGMIVERSSSIVINEQFRGLLIGVSLIIGLMATFLIPYFFRNYKIFF